jgi:superfamily II DNA/RNA helicase
VSIDFVDVTLPRSTAMRVSSTQNSPVDYVKEGFKIKSNALLKSLRSNKSKRTIIFCNTIPSCRELENFLSRHDRNKVLWDVGLYHGAVSDVKRADCYKRFVSDDCHSFGSKRKNVVVDKLLICTDRAARGVDFSGQPVDHVVIFDFPKDPAEYVRRVGRTGRGGRTGKVTVFAHGWQVSVAKETLNMGEERERIDVYIKEKEELEDEDGEEELYGRRKKKKEVRGLGKVAGDRKLLKDIGGGVMWEKKSKNETKDATGRK